MTDNKRVQRIFLRAVEARGPERMKILQDECGSDADLRRRVEVLLCAHDAPDSLLDSPPPGVTTSAEAELSGLMRPGQTIGPYKLLQQIGEGGFGVVFMAEQREPIQRQVAIKIIKPGMDSKQVVARFESERQALALMDHPNIAKVLDAGATEAGRPFFVMELVKGVPITKFSDQQRLSTRDRLELFIPVCHAIQHAHQKGVIHRDVKPSNILVSLYDGHPVPKVIDFGVAKAIQHRLTEKTVFTQFGQVIGTLEYMSPEQAEFNQLDIDTRSDVYSLGAVLYEVLSGSPPFERDRMRSAAFDELLRMIRDEEPPRPSRRLSSSQQLPGISMQRQCEPSRLCRILRGELDWVVMKAIEKQRSRRYETAEGLARDIRSYLDDEPVDAGPPSAQYRLWKMARKHRKTFAVAGSFVLLLTVAATLFMWLAVVAKREANNANVARNDERVAKHQMQIARDLAAKNEREAITSLRKANAMQLAAKSESLRDASPVLSTLLGIEAMEATTAYGIPVQPSAREALLQAAAGLGGRPLTGHTGDVHVVRISQDSRWLLTAGGGGVARLWDLEASDPLASPLALAGHVGEVTLAEMSADSRWLVTVDADHVARAWNLKSRNPAESAKTMQGHLKEIVGLAFSSDGQRVATGSDDGSVRLWNLSVPRPSLESIVMDNAFASPEQGHPFSCTLEFSPDDRWLLSGENFAHTRNCRVRLWDTERGQSPRVVELPGHDDGLHSPWDGGNLFTSDGRWLVTNDFRKTRIWDLSAADPSATGRVILEGNAACAISHSGRWLVAGRHEPDEILLFDLQADAPEKASSLLLAGAKIAWPYFSPGDRWMVARTDGDTLRVFDLTAENVQASMMTLPRHRAQRYRVSGNDSLLVTGDDKNVVRVWKLLAEDPAELQCVVKSHDGTYVEPTISPDSRWLVTHSQGDHIPRLWNLQRLAKGMLPAVFADRMSVSSNGRWAVHGPQSTPTVITRLDLMAEESTETTVSIPTSVGPAWTSITDDGNRFLAQSGANSIQIWDLEGNSAALWSSLQLPKNAVDYFTASAVLSPDYDWIAALHRPMPGRDGPSQIHLCALDRKSDGSIKTLPTEAMAEVCFFNAAKQLVALGRKTIERWDVTADNVESTHQVIRHVSPLKASASIRGGIDGRWILTLDEGGVLRVWDTDSSIASHQTWTGFPPASRIVAVDMERKMMVTRSRETEDSTVLWCLGKDATEQIAGFGNISLGRACFSPDGKWIALSSNRTVYLWPIEDMNPTVPFLTLPDHAGWVDLLRFSPDSRRLCTGDRTGFTYLWDLDDEVLVQRARNLAGRRLTTAELEKFSLTADQESGR